MADVRTPNSEQKLAIEHNGGVLLQAGAGSGKTFVLVEHIIYLINNFTEKNKTLEEEDFIFELKDYLGKIVLMTFTNKAAGELLTRLYSRLKLEIENRSDLENLKYAQEAIHSLNTGTIHGFCLKLIHRGFFPTLDSELQIMTEEEMKGLIESYIISYLNRVESSDFIQVLRAHKNDMVKAFVKVFGDAQLRIEWENFNVETEVNKNVDEYVAEYILLSGFSWLFNTDFREIADFEEADEKKKWFQYLLDFQALSEPTSLESLKKVSDYLSSFKRSPSKPRNCEPLLGKYFSDLSSLKKKLKTDLEVFDKYSLSQKSEVKDWLYVLKNVFQYVNKQYSDSGRINFADFEYLVYKGLKQPQILEQIQAQYEYFIIDEFQDTSTIQFDIIRVLIDNNFEKVFCVGDIKQAIYGFRGGEISVFQECSNLVPQNLSLSNNYRSEEEVINFNNDFFTRIFKLGLNFEGEDVHQVPVAKQTVPDFKQGLKTGVVDVYNVDLSDADKKLTSAEVNSFEAQAIYKVLTDNKSKYTNQSVLYKKLAPSFNLFETLLENEESFTCQVKLKLSEEPIILAFLTLLESKFDKDRGLDYSVFHLKHIFSHLGLEKDQLVERIQKFYQSADNIGPSLSFQQFLFELGVSNALYKNNIQFVDVILRVAEYDLEKSYDFIKRSSDEMLSVDFQFGENPGQIVIMTVHSSKGLEFEHVILGGIHTNGRFRNNTDFFGSQPGALKWKPEATKKKMLDTPMFLIEKLESKLKDFSEDKRLFYVANTRAEKKLSWISFLFADKDFSIPKNSWINSLDDENIQAILNDHEIKGTSLEIETVELSGALETPFFHRNNMGVLDKDMKNKSTLLVLPELSVTKLAFVADCPRKFYLGNLLKISEDDFDLLNLEKSYEASFNFDDDSEFEVKKSSSQRGTLIHEKLSQMIDKNFVVPREIDGTKDEAAFHWVSDELKKLSASKFISEVPLKFPVFGHMISGIPDLIIDGDSFEVWDFKTGMPKTDNNSYWFQLYMYAYSVYVLGMCDKSQTVKISLVFVDAQKKIDEEVTFQAASDYILSYWKKLNDPNQVNLEHCSDCLYGNMCRP